MDIKEIKKAIKEERINITEHADEELEDDEISNEDLYASVFNGEIIEDYPKDFPFPSCLIYGRDRKGKAIHSVWAYSEDDQIAVLITAYLPDSNKWIEFKIRRKR